MTKGIGKVGLNSLHILLATAALALLQWVIMAVIGRGGGPAELGAYSLVQAYATPAFFLAFLSLRQQHLISSGPGAQDADFLALRLTVPIAVSLAVVTLIALVYGSPALTAMAAAVCCFRYVDGLFDLSYGRLQQRGDTWTMAHTTFSRSLASVAVFAGVFAATTSVSYGLLAVSVVCLALFWLQRNQLGPHPAMGEVLDLSRDAVRRRTALILHLLPLGLSNVITALNANAPRLILDGMLGPTELGYFAAVFQLYAIGLIAVASLGHAILPGLAEAVRSNAASQFWRQLAIASGIVILLCVSGLVAAALLGEQVIRLIYGPLFADKGYLVLCAALAAGPAFLADLIANACYAARLRRILLGSQIVVLMAIIATTFLLSDRLGAASAFAALFLGGCLQSIIGLVSLHRFWKEKPGGG